MSSPNKRVIGLCLGASTLSVVDLSRLANGRVHVNSVLTTPHTGNPKDHLRDVLGRYDPAAYDNIGVTGRKFRASIRAPGISEPEAVESALQHIQVPPAINLLLSIGGETFMAYVLGRDRTITAVHTGNKCASGTGEFFLQQIGRMGLDIDEALRIADPDKAYRISSRCSVFCKSDCTHALNKGTGKEAIVSGLCRMVATKMLELVNKSRRQHVLAIGGVTRNRPAMEFLRAHLPLLFIPPEAHYFEALGAALWALRQPEPFRLDINSLFTDGTSHFSILPRLTYYADRVAFRSMDRAEPRVGDECILGLDVGSTTTKAVLLRVADDALLASCYRRTDGDPVGASRACYQSIADSLGRTAVRIIGLGTTGSGRQIAGLHALTLHIINEIIAHARAAVFWDPEVDTIFEIGGQDAKYTHLTNGVPSDYAMNEACSAGTGSFLEESARESLGIHYTEIADLALQAHYPPNFNDQCAAFISSDIKNASHEGIRREDIVAGLIYSIALNYINRVKGPRPVGRKVFMQGGVCYNRAVPIAMAMVTGKNIVVPPEPGLMGAFGVALDIKDKLRLGLIEEQEFCLEELANRPVEQLDAFTCTGGPEKCDRKCLISNVRINGHNYPFGGACNRWYNLRMNRSPNAADFDHIAERQRLVFQRPSRSSGLTVGLNRSFLTHTYYPFYHAFFDALGFRIVMPDAPDPAGVDRKDAAFCYPYEIAHGMFLALLNLQPDWIFLPHIMELPVPGARQRTHTCPLVQSEPFVLRSTFREEAAGRRILAPRLNFHGGLRDGRRALIKMANRMGIARRAAARAFALACRAQADADTAIAAQARSVLQTIENCDDFAVVIFGRAYSAFPHEANLAIPHKFASRGIHAIPCSALPWEGEETHPHMYWANGQVILKAARYVRRHRKLFGVFITNFSCGPDSFIVGHFRDIMGTKPSLTLELDSQTADAGVDTRIEAFLDVVRSYRELERKQLLRPDDPGLPPPRTILRGRHTRIVCNRRTWKLQDVHLVFPSVGALTTPAFAAISRSLGIHASALPPPDAEALRLGHGNTMCKECLPLILITGSLLKYLTHNDTRDEFTAFFVPIQIDPCRLCQYPGFFDRLIRNNRLANVGVISLTDLDGWGGFGDRWKLRAWTAIAIADMLDDIRAALLALAANREDAMRTFDAEWHKVLDALQQWRNLDDTLRAAASVLRAIPLRQPYQDAVKILLTGEIYVRRDDISRQNLVNRLAERGIVVCVTPSAENCYYANFVARNRLDRIGLGRCIRSHFEYRYLLAIERRLRNILATTGLLTDEMVDVDRTVAHADHLVGRHIKGEISLTVGGSLREIAHSVSGVIAIGPFGCMPSRVSEAILTREMTRRGRQQASGQELFIDIDELPFLALESDAGVFPQIIDTRIETFCMQAVRLHQKMYPPESRPGESRP